MKPTSQRRLARFRHALCISVLCFSSPSQAQQAPQASAPEVRIDDITDQQEIKRLTTHFNEQLRRLGSKDRVKSCDPLIEYTIRSLGGHDYSFGGFCTISNPKDSQDLFMCDDNMIGEFTMGGAGGADKESVARFIQKNCPPGG